MVKDAIQKRMSAKKKQVLKALNDGMGIVSYACKVCNISRNTFYVWKNNDEVFAHECEIIQENTIDNVESKLFKAISKGNLTAIIFYLKTHGKKRGYVESINNNVNVNSFEELLKQIPEDNEDDKK